MKILVNWDYERPDLMKQFDILKQDIEFVFIYKNSEPQEGKELLYGQHVLYWNNFNSPYQLLNEAKPDKIIFHDIESFLQVSLNIAAQNTGIQTLVFEHGLRGDYEVDIALQSYTSTIAKRTRTNGNEDSKLSAKNKSSLQFYLRAFKLKNIASLFHFLLFPFIRKKYGLTVGLYKCPFKLREANAYINFTNHNASYILKRDGVSIKKIISIGNPCFDDIFIQLGKTIKNSANYYLLIDCPYCEQSIFKMKKETKAAFYLKLNAFCLSHNSRLKIKLHPQSYVAEYLPLHANIEYFREFNIAELIANAKACFLINLSTLSPLAMYYSKCVYFNTEINPYDKELIDNEYIPSYNFNTFNPSELIFTELTSEVKKEIKERYLYSTDGKATERLSNILNQS